MQQLTLTKRDCIRLYFFLPCLMFFAVEMSPAVAGSVRSDLIKVVLEVFVVDIGLPFVMEIDPVADNAIDKSIRRQQLDVIEQVVPGYLEAAEALARRAGNEPEARLLGKALVNEVLRGLHGKDITIGRLLACNICFGPILLAEDASVYSDRAAIRLAMSGLMEYRRPGGKRLLSLGNSHDRIVGAVARVLADALEQVRSRGDVDGDSFEKTVSDALYETATEASRKRQWLKAVSLDGSDRTLDFEIDVAGTRVSVVAFDVGTFAERLKSLLVFGGGGAGSTAILLKRDDRSTEAKKARKKKSVGLKTECKNVSQSRIFPIPTDQPPQCGGGLGRSDIEAVNKHFLFMIVMDSHKRMGDSR